MKKISEGKFELSTTRADAIKKFMQLPYICRETLNYENGIHFYCNENGKISIVSPPSRFVTSDNSTNLYAEIIEQDGKAYVSYYTAFSKSNYLLKMIVFSVCLIIIIGAIILALIGLDKRYSIFSLIFTLVLIVYSLYTASNEESASPMDSEILIGELEKRVEAVNLWDK